MLVTAFLHFWPEGHQQPRSEVGSLSTAERLAGFKPGSFRLWLQRFNPLGHSPQDTQDFLKNNINSTSILSIN